MQTTQKTKQTVNRAYFIDHIRLTWPRAIATGHDLGFSLVESRISLPANEWREFVVDDLPCDLVVACRFLKLVQGQRVPGAAVGGPYSFYEAIRLEEPIFRFGVDNSLITPACGPAELAVLKSQFKAAAGK